MLGSPPLWSADVGIRLLSFPFLADPKCWRDGSVSSVYLTAQWHSVSVLAITDPAPLFAITRVDTIGAFLVDHNYFESICSINSHLIMSQNILIRRGSVLAEFWQNVNTNVLPSGISRSILHSSYKDPDHLTLLNHFLFQGYSRIVPISLMLTPLPGRSFPDLIA